MASRQGSFRYPICTAIECRGRLNGLAVAQRRFPSVGVATLLEQAAGFLEARVRLLQQHLLANAVICGGGQRHLFGCLLDGVEWLARQ
jgi:hypothetical protein